MRRRPAQALPLSPAEACANHSKLDYACTTAVSLAQLALYSGDRVGLLAYGQAFSSAFCPDAAQLICAS